VIPLLALDIQTLPDVAGIRTLYQLDDEISDADVVYFALQRSRASRADEFMPYHLHRIVGIHAVLHIRQEVELHCSEAGQDEASMLQTLSALLNEHTPQIVSWHGSLLMLPVLRHRAMLHGIAFPGGANGLFGQTLELSRLLCQNAQPGCVPQQEMAGLCGLPRIPEHDAPQSWATAAAGKLPALLACSAQRAACHYLMWLRLAVLQGQISALTRSQHEQKLALLLGQQGEEWQGFLQQWTACNRA
jgi:predicted PolB exonuclease-like 3'-5' exonuclease